MRIQKRNGSSRYIPISPYSIISHFLVGLIGFYGGLLVSSTSTRQPMPPMAPSLEQRRLPVADTPTISFEYPDTVGDIIAGSARVPRSDFITQFDLGVPWDEPKRGTKDVFILYNSKGSLPVNYNQPNQYFESSLNATANCVTMNMILQKTNAKGQCLAIVGQWESYHVHKFMRVRKDDLNKKSKDSFISLEYPLKHVSREHDAHHDHVPQFPTKQQAKSYNSWLLDYLSKFEIAMERLIPIAKEVAGKDNTIVVMVCNWGQSELLFNFVCSARARGFDLSKVLLFATDKDVYDLSVSLGIATFEVKDTFGPMPTEAAKTYGDRKFRGMMMSKVYCVHMINALGYDLLFQDVDVVWYQDPLAYFHSPESGEFDFYFQDDGAHSLRYTPYSPNSGFYFVRHTPRTKYFFEVFSRMGDLVIASGSHQSVLNGLLADHSSSRGLRVKVFQRDSELGRAFPGGYHFHKRKNFMKEVITGKRKPYIFHMSWTTNKENKQNFYQQLGEWFLKDNCVSTKVDEIERESSSVVEHCCSADVLFQCHYRDKPSLRTCESSDPIDKNGRSFW